MSDSSTEPTITSAGEPGDPVGRRWLPGVLVAVATVLAVISTFSTWVRVQALDTDTWVAASDQLLAEPEVQEALSVYLVDELYRQVDVQAEIEAQLPDNLKGLAGPISAGLRSPATAGAQRLVASDQFRTVWVTANRAAHQTLVNVLRDETRPGVSTTDGTVTLDLGELVRLVGEKLGLSAGVLDRLPEDAGQVTVFESDDLASAQRAVQVLDFLSWFLFLLVVALYATAVYIAGDRRLTVLRNVGLSLVGAGVVILIIRVIALRLALDAIVANPASRPWAGVVAFVYTTILRQMSWSGVFYGILIAGFAILLGGRGWARSTRRALAPALNAPVGAVAGGTVLFLLLLLWWSPGRAFDRWVTGLTLIALVIGAVIALRRTAQREYATVTFADVGRSVGNAVGAARRGVNPDPGATTVAAQLESLRALHTSGGLDDAEYVAAKQKVLAGDQADDGG